MVHLVIYLAPNGNSGNEGIQVRLRRQMLCALLIVGFEFEDVGIFTFRPPKYFPAIKMSAEDVIIAICKLLGAHSPGPTAV